MKNFIKLGFGFYLGYAIANSLDENLNSETNFINFVVHKVVDKAKTLINKKGVN